MGKENARCHSARVASNRRKGSLEVFGGAPRLQQAGVFAQPTAVQAAWHELQEEESNNASNGSSLFESMMIDSGIARAQSSMGRYLERSLSERTSRCNSSSSQLQLQAMAEDRGTLVDSGVPAIRRYSLSEDQLKADPVQCSGYQGGISTEVLRALATFQQTFVVTDATQPDCPIMFASACFLAMTGYSHGEVVGRNCRFLQGPGTDCREVARLRECLRGERNFSGILLNYKKNGSPFWNLLTITPIRDAHDHVIMCIGMQTEVSKPLEGCREISLRPSGLSNSLVRYESRQIDQAADAVSEIMGAFRKTSLAVVPATMAPPTPQPEVDFGTGGYVHSNPFATSTNSKYRELLRGRSRRESRTTTSEPCPSPRSPEPKRRRRLPKLMSLLGFTSNCKGASQRREEGLDGGAMELQVANSEEEEEEGDDKMKRDRAQVIRRAFDLASSLERIQKNFVITDPRLPDNPIIFASDQFLELTEYSREDVIGCNCRFLQGPETDPATVRQIRDAIAECRDITVQLVNYTKSGRPFWNLFHLQAVRDSKGEVQYFVGVQQNPQGRSSDHTERERAKLGQHTATTINEAVRELPNANLVNRTAPSVAQASHHIHQQCLLHFHRSDPSERIHLNTPQVNSIY